MHEYTAPLYRICHRAGKELRQLYAAHLRRPLQVRIKDDGSPVTEADRLANEILLEELAALCPGVPVLSEETQVPAYSQRRRWSQFWLVDPLDGTREFIEGSGQFCISVALVEGNRPQLGAIYLPLAGLLYIGGVGHPPMLYCPDRAQPLLPRAAHMDSPLKLLCSRRGNADPGVVGLRRQLEGRFPWLLSELRGSAWKYCRICEGAGHIYPRFGVTSEWDTAAGQALLEAAGGSVVDFEGRALLYNTGDELQNPPFFALSPASFCWRDVLKTSF